MKASLRLTIKTVQNIKITDNMTIIDDDGLSHELTKRTVIDMVQIAWGTFIAAWIMNIAYYKVSSI